MRAALSAAIEAANHKAVSRASKVFYPFFIICILSFWWKWRKNVSLSGTKVCLASKWLQHNNRRIDTNFKGGHDSFEQLSEFHLHRKLYILCIAQKYGRVDISISPQVKRHFVAEKYAAEIEQMYAEPADGSWPLHGSSVWKSIKYILYIYIT